MPKYKRFFQDWAMQGLYETFRRSNMDTKRARREVISRFKEYDEEKNFINLY
jgi:hypothetical protein